MSLQQAKWYDELFLSGDYFRFWVKNSADPLIPDKWTLSEVEFIKSALSLPRNARILDLCCGHGRHAVPLAREGYRMCGLDFSRKDLLLAREAATKEGLDIQWLEADMREIPLSADGGMDSVINMFTSFGYFEEEADNQRVLDSIGNVLKKGGLFLLDVPNLIGRMRNYRDRDWAEIDGTLVLRNWEYDAIRSRINDQVTIVEPDGGSRVQSWSIRLYTYVELKAMLNQAGLSPVKVWGGLNSTELTHESLRMVILAEKSV